MTYNSAHLLVTDCRCAQDLMMSPYSVTSHMFMLVMSQCYEVFMMSWCHAVISCLITCLSRADEHQSSSTTH